MKNFKSQTGQFAKSGTAKIMAVGSAMMASSAALATDHSLAISAAQTDATTSVTTAVAGIIGVAAVVTGVGFVLRFLTR
ncbi:hypothetical protein [Thalassotalea sp. ND16A]|uniref:hypothetical protein n=1 Tax=Thalassotalea sp. ND16A TaxID=1535422 RepID=UPI00051A13A1|nr:hypothetical protein [Thalassotalea sp. ND16A]KGK00284.1 hypothetical protein ND16A_3620 [Thalassotalea sp. ND16A]